MTSNIPNPKMLPETQHYWEGANRGELLIKFCMSCNEPHHYPREICPHCLSEKTDWFRASGKGEIYSFSVIKRDGESLVLAYVTLKEGVTLMTNIVDVPFEELEVGMEVQVTFPESESGQAVPMFTRSI